MTKFNAAFWKWFGDSKVIDAKGRPLVVWHSGTVKNEFDISLCEFGCHFGTRGQVASSFKGSENAAKPYFLSIQKPLRMQDLFVFDTLSVSDRLIDMGIIDGKWLEQAFRIHNETKFADDAAATAAANDIIRRKMMSIGYDGIVYLNRHEGVSASCPEDSDDLGDEEFRRLCPKALDSWIILDARQAKSATHNDETWDADDPDIRSNPPVLFHHTSSENRESIARSGLLSSRDQTGFGGVFLIDEATPHGSDVWRVSGLDVSKLERDHTWDGPEKSYIYYGDIPKKNIKLVAEGHDVESNPPPHLVREAERIIRKLERKR